MKANPETDNSPIETETLDEIALRIAAGPYPSYSQLIKRRKLADEILSALRNERERCAKVAESHNEDHVSDFKNCGLAIAEEIRHGSK